MHEAWTETVWGELATLEYGRALRTHQDTVGSVRVYGTNGPIGWHTEAQSEGPGVIIGRKGAYRGIHYSPGPFFVIDTAFYLAPTQDLNLRWAYYNLLLYDINSMDSGSAIPSTSRDEFYQIPVLVPTKRIQDAIASTLGALDDKIELNRRMNDTLEAMARAIFKSWFVDFDPVRAKAEGRRPFGMDDATAALFPDRFGPGGLPVGWSYRSVEALVLRAAMGPFGSRIKTENFVAEGIPVIRGQNLVDGFVDDNFVYLTEKKAQELRSAAAYPGDIIFTHRGTLGQVGRIPQRSRHKKYIASQSQMLLSVDSAKTSSQLVYWFFRSSEGQYELLANANPTGVPSIARPLTSLKAIRVITPDPSVARAFDTIIEPLEEKAVSNHRENATLSALRDLLLPKLMSGEIGVNEAEQALDGPRNV